MFYFIFQKWWYNYIEKTFGSKHGLITKQCEEEINIKHKNSNGNATYKKFAISFSAISNLLGAMDIFKKLNV
jgi:hypothetical protein